MARFGMEAPKLDGKDCDLALEMSDWFMTYHDDLNKLPVEDFLDKHYLDDCMTTGPYGLVHEGRKEMAKFYQSWKEKNLQVYIYYLYDMRTIVENVATIGVALHVVDAFGTEQSPGYIKNDLHIRKINGVWKVRFETYTFARDVPRRSIHLGQAFNMNNDLAQRRSAVENEKMKKMLDREHEEKQKRSEAYDLIRHTPAEIARKEKEREARRLKEAKQKEINKERDEKRRQERHRIDKANGFSDEEHWIAEDHREKLARYNQYPGRDKEPDILPTLEELIAQHRKRVKQWKKEAVEYDNKSSLVSNYDDDSKNTPERSDMAMETEECITNRPEATSSTEEEPLQHAFKNTGLDQHEQMLVKERQLQKEWLRQRDREQNKEERMDLSTNNDRQRSKGTSPKIKDPRGTYPAPSFPSLHQEVPSTPELTPEGPDPSRFNLYGQDMLIDATWRADDVKIKTMKEELIEEAEPAEKEWLRDRVFFQGPFEQPPGEDVDANSMPRRKVIVGGRNPNQSMLELKKFMPKTWKKTCDKYIGGE